MKIKLLANSLAIACALMVSGTASSENWTKLKDADKKANVSNIRGISRIHNKGGAHHNGGVHDNNRAPDNSRVPDNNRAPDNGNTNNQSLTLLTVVNNPPQALVAGDGASLPPAEVGATPPDPSAQVPEPMTLTLIGIGLASFVARRRF